MKTKLRLSKNVTMNKPDEKRQGMQVRTVVTGHNAKGRAVFVRDEKVDGMPIPGLGELAFLWNADEPATYPNAGNNPAARGIFPPLGGIRFIIGTYFRETSLHQNPLPRCTSRMATNSVELTPAFTGPTRRISGSFSPATWHSSSTMARRCRCLPAMSRLRTELATVGAWLGTCRPPWLLSSSEPSAVRIRPAREVREDRHGYV